MVVSAGGDAGCKSSHKESKDSGNKKRQQSTSDGVDGRCNSDTTATAIDGMMAAVMATATATAIEGAMATAIAMAAMVGASVMGMEGVTATQRQRQQRRWKAQG